ncbi:hypothetical protein [Ottowia sp. SB7-C50]|uniref:hypothetical protein n=1 Tax=Ottowia sp. SB7-C50 TaxID=3081231 RepID=UPI002952DBC9|nr:hypothetical protein [Ottowia sp. SB7-C50]WOP16951.1 hypothetical protein R0D99_08235 [Ottowia sp. SB7-C50]
MRVLVSAGVYSTPAARNACGEATDALNVAASCEEMSGTSISARSGSPKAERTLMAPSAKACASKATAPHKASAAAVATTPVLHGCRAMLS